MAKKTDQQGRGTTWRSSDTKLDFLALLQLIDQHYDKLDSAGSLSLTQTHSGTNLIEAIFDSVTEALLSVSAEGVIRSCNKICTRYFGVSREVLIGSRIANILPGIGDGTLAEFLEPFMCDVDDTQVELVGGETTASRTNGDNFAAEINASRLVSPEVDIFVISLRDISGRKRAEGTSKENDERYRALVEYAAEAVLVLDVDSNRFCDANDQACQLFNLSRARLISIGPKAVSPRMQPDGRPSSGAGHHYVEEAMKGGASGIRMDAPGRERTGLPL